MGAKDPRMTPAHLPATCPLWLLTSRVQEEGADQWFLLTENTGLLEPARTMRPGQREEAGT